MITLKELKGRIEHNTIGDECYLFYGNSADAKFLMLQYINAISNNLKLDIDYQSSLNNTDNFDLFNVANNSIKVYMCHEFCGQFPSNKKYYYILADKIKDVSFENSVEFTKLENWQIKDYVYSNLDGVDTKKLDYLCELCKFDIYKLAQEIKRFSLFNKNELPYVFDDFSHGGGYSLLSNKNIFDLSNAIIHKDINNIVMLYQKLDIIDVEPIGLLTVLINNFRDIISIQLSNNASPESCGMPPNKFWAIKKNNCNIWSRDELVHNYKFLLSLDKEIKTGKLANDIVLIDYMLVNIL